MFNRLSLQTMLFDRHYNLTCIVFFFLNHLVFPFPKYYSIVITAISCVWFFRTVIWPTLKYTYPIYPYTYQLYSNRFSFKSFIIISSFFTWYYFCFNIVLPSRLLYLYVLSIQLYILIFVESLTLSYFSDDSEYLEFISLYFFEKLGKFKNLEKIHFFLILLVRIFLRT